MFDFRMLDDIMNFVETNRLLLSFIHFVDGVRLKKAVALSSRVSGMEACIQLSREIFPREVIHITLTFFLAVLSAFGALASIVSLMLYVHDRKKK